MSRPRFELRTFCVLDRCDNQLRHRPGEKATSEQIHRQQGIAELVLCHYQCEPEHLSEKYTIIR